MTVEEISDRLKLKYGDSVEILTGQELANRDVELVDLNRLIGKIGQMCCYSDESYKLLQLILEAKSRLD